MFVFAVAATLVASQAMITATFSLTQQVINLKSLPPIRMVHTSDTVQGQVYVPAVNWILMILTIVFVAAFKDLAALTNAYGFAVATVMLSTTGLLAIQMFYVKRWPIVVGILFFLFYGFIDGELLYTLNCTGSLTQGPLQDCSGELRSGRFLMEHGFPL